MYSGTNTSKQALDALNSIFNGGIANANLDLSYTLGERTKGALYLVAVHPDPLYAWVSNNADKLYSYELGTTFPTRGTVRMALREGPFLRQLIRIFEV